MPLARAPALERPTAVVFDLDPGPPATHRRVLPGRPVAARDVRAAGARRASPRRRARRAFRSTCRSTARSPTSKPSRFARRRRRSSSSSAQPALVVSRMTQDAARGQGADRLEPERRAQDDGLRLLAARARAPDGVRRRCEWDELRATLQSADPDALSLRRPRRARASRERGDLFAPALSLAQTLPRALSVPPRRPHAVQWRYDQSQRASQESMTALCFIEHRGRDPRDRRVDRPRGAPRARPARSSPPGSTMIPERELAAHYAKAVAGLDDEDLHALAVWHCVAQRRAAGRQRATSSSPCSRASASAAARR